VARALRGPVHFHNARDILLENNIFIDGTLQQIEMSGWVREQGTWNNHIESMTKGFNEYSNLPAWQKYRGLRGAAPRQAVPMADNRILRNIIFYRNPDAKFVRHSNLPLDRFQSDYNLLYHFDQPILTGITKLKGVQTRNLAPNASFEDGAPDTWPTDWRWHINPGNAAKAFITTETAHSGTRSLRMDGLSIPKEDGTSSYPAVMSNDLPVKPGQTYRLTAWLKSSNANARAAMLVQSYKANVYYWGRDSVADVGTDWKQYEMTFTVPAPGTKEFNADLKTLWIRFDLREGSGALWIDDVQLSEAVIMDEWSAWKSLGFDKNSVVANPQFRNAAKDDYRLLPTSPAFKLGFKPIPVEKIGPYKSELRASWPIVEAVGAREKPLVSP
jgi:hypothetical protein